MKRLSESEKAFEWVGTVTNPKYERNYQVGKLENWLGDTRSIFHVIGTRDGLQKKI